MDDASRDRVRPEAPLSSETVLREFAPHPYQSLNEDGEIITVNEAWEDLLGYTRADVAGEWFGSFLTDSSTDRFESLFSEFKSCGDVSEVEFDVIHSDGHSFTITLDGRIEYGDDGAVLRTHCQFHDIDERKARERELLELEETVESIFSNVPLAVFAFDENGVFTRSQGHALEELYSDPSEAVGQSVFDMFADRPDILDHCERALDGEQVTATVELRGTVFESWYQPIREDGEVVGVVGHSYNITDRVDRKRELERSRDLLRHTETLTRTGGWEVDIDTGEQRWTDGTYAIHDLSSDDEFDLSVEDGIEFYHPDDRDRIEQVVRRCMADGEPYDEELRLITAEDRLRWVRSVGEAVYEGDEITKIRGAIRDITERKKREQALERYERLVDNLPIGVYRYTSEPTDEFTLVNDAMAEMFGADSKEQLLNRPTRDFYVDPADHAALHERLVAQSVVRSIEERLETLDGRTIWGEITAIAADVDGEMVVDGAVQDITERKKYEQRLMEQRDNLEILNQVLRHDIRNDLQLVTAYADIIADECELEEVQPYLDTLWSSADHAVELTRTARDMADVMLTTADDRQQITLQSPLETELEEIRSTHPEATVAIDGAIPSVTVVGNDMLASVFRNLLKNAIQHNDKETPKVTVSATERDESVVVRIADNGPGVPDEQKDDIFGKGEKGLDSHGTGIGLYLVQTLVETYGGDMWVADNDPEGAVFVVELPTST
jgi:PAS domain S-box-containing protein